MRLLLISLALTGTVCLGACGDDAPAPLDVRWSESKPNPTVGRIRAAVVERPSIDRAVIEARWENRSGAESCAVELVVPDGVMILEGDRREDIPGDQGAGTATWRVEFPVGRTLDAVLRFCAETPDGLRSCETSIRLVD